MRLHITRRPSTLPSRAARPCARRAARRGFSVLARDPARAIGSFDRDVTWSAGKDTTIISEPLNDRTINGTSQADRVTIRENWSSVIVIVTVNGKSKTPARGEISGEGLIFNLGGGNDSFSAAKIAHLMTAPLVIEGDTDNDTITPGDADDKIDGGTGRKDADVHVKDIETLD